MCGASVDAAAAIKELFLPPTAVYSRATQRLLRDLPGLCNESNLRGHGKAAESMSVKMTLLRTDPKFKMLLRVPEDPVVSNTLSIPIIPNSHVSFGGEIGQWGERASELNKLGSISKASGIGNFLLIYICNFHVLND